VDFDSDMSVVVQVAVALVNATTPGERGGRPVEAPTGPSLTAAVAAALAPATRPSDGPVTGPVAGELAGWATRLRAVVELVDAGDLDAACTGLNDVLRDADAVPTLSRHDGEGWHLHFHRPDAGTAVGWVAGMATGLAIVLGGPAVERLGLCHAPHCDRAYLDTSRNGTRRFCSTACQNRVKAAAFRARREAAPAG
jgi:predicted RNA-binding Zn ribbon-like protein